MHSRKRFIIGAALVVAACVALGGRFGRYIGSAASIRQKDAVQEDVRSFERVLDVIRAHHGEPAKIDEAIYKVAIPTALRQLDPHSQFYDPDAFRFLREQQRGSYAGVGMEIAPFEGTVVVNHPFPGTPAFEAGVRPGDVIAEIDGEPAKGWGTEEVADRARGPEGTLVKLGLRRWGTPELIEVNVVRASIPRPSIPVAFFLEPGVGYIKILTFSETTGRELDHVLERFGERGLEALVLDLRENRGGLLSSGVHVTERFLRKGQVIVSHHGRNSRERVYRVRDGHDGEMYPMTVLVDCHSASAAEIVAGALQDHDRALIVGSNTFGKGLVQSVFDLSHTTGLVLSTARYYTPSGRLIQRPYDNISLSKYHDDPCSAGYEPVNTEPRLTDNGRTVYGGGGVTPDVKFEEERRTSFKIRLETRRAFESFAARYTIGHPDLRLDWEPDNGLLADFRGHLEQLGMPLGDEQFENEKAYLHRSLKKNVYKSAFHLYEGMRVDIELDPAVRRAAQLFPEARALLKRAEKTLAQNTKLTSDP